MHAEKASGNQSHRSDDVSMLNARTLPEATQELPSDGNQSNRVAHTQDGVETADESHIVTVQTVFDGMLKGKTVRVKIFYVPVGIRRFPRRYGKEGGDVEVFKSRVGCSGHEYDLVALGNQAAEAANALRDCSGSVVELARVKHSMVKGHNQLELQENFTITIVPTGFDLLRQQQLKTIALTSAANVENFATVSLTPVRVKERTELRYDKNGRPFRSAQLVDSYGFVCAAIAWGCVSASEEIWDEGNTVDIMNAYVNKEDERLDLRDDCCVQHASAGSRFEVPRRLQMVSWKKW